MGCSQIFSLQSGVRTLGPGKSAIRSVFDPLRSQIHNATRSRSAFVGIMRAFGTTFAHLSAHLLNHNFNDRRCIQVRLGCDRVVASRRAARKIAGGSWR